jgi:hypothetical protein
MVGRALPTPFARFEGGFLTDFQDLPAFGI